MGKVRLCFIGDGAGWFWDTVQSIYPDCRQVLVYFYCAQRLHDFAHIHFGQNAQANEWVEQDKVHLFHNNIKGVFISLNNLKCRTAEAQKARATLVGYLKSNKAVLITASYVGAAILWAVGLLKAPTSLFVTCG